jgi:hypothetical protein
LENRLLTGCSPMSAPRCEGTREYSKPSANTAKVRQQSAFTTAQALPAAADELGQPWFASPLPIETSSLASR